MSSKMDIAKKLYGDYIKDKDLDKFKSDLKTKVNDSELEKIFLEFINNFPNLFDEGLSNLFDDGKREKEIMIDNSKLYNAIKYQELYAFSDCDTERFNTSKYLDKVDKDGIPKNPCSYDAPGAITREWRDNQLTCVLRAYEYQNNYSNMNCISPKGVESGSPRFVNVGYMVFKNKELYEAWKTRSRPAFIYSTNSQYPISNAIDRKKYSVDNVIWIFYNNSNGWKRDDEWGVKDGQTTNYFPTRDKAFEFVGKKN